MFTRCDGETETRCARSTRPSRIPYAVLRGAPSPTSFALRGRPWTVVRFLLRTKCGGDPRRRDLIQCAMRSRLQGQCSSAAVLAPAPSGCRCWHRRRRSGMGSYHERSSDLLRDAMLILDVATAAAAAEAAAAATGGDTNNATKGQARVCM